MQSEDLGYKFKKIHCCFKSNGNAKAKKFDLTQTQMNILHYLFWNIKNKPITQRDIEKHFDMKHSTTIGILGRMEKNGFLKLSISETDRRQRNITLMDKAYAVKAECEAQKSQTESKFREKLTKEEFNNLEVLLDKVYDILKEETQQC